MDSPQKNTEETPRRRATRVALAAFTVPERRRIFSVSDVNLEYELIRNGESKEPAGTRAVIKKYIELATALFKKYEGAK